MKRIVYGFVLVTLALWGLNLWVHPVAMNTRAVVHEAFYINGVLAWGFMAMAIVIAARPAWLERVTGTPLDALYRWHKVIGIWAGVLTAVHYFTKTLMQPVLGLMTLESAPRPAANPNLEGFDAFWSWLRGFSNTTAEWATILGAVLLVVTFVSALRYHRWLTTHRLFSIIFLAVAAHSIRLMDAEDYLTPFGLLNILITVVGCWYSLVLLVRGPGREKTTRAVVESVVHDQDLTLVTVRPERPLAIAAGEFAFLRLPGHEKHPFSAAEIHDDATVSFAVKGLGDFTRETMPQLAAGDKIWVEGPWGSFRPDYKAANQLWVAGGVGIAPFCAWLKDAARNTHGAIRLVWCIRSRESEPLYRRVRDLAQAAGVTLEVYESSKGRLDPDRLFSGLMPGALAMCAGAGLSRSVEEAYVKAGGRTADIRREYFDWR